MINHGLARRSAHPRLLRQRHLPLRLVALHENLRPPRLEQVVPDGLHDFGQRKLPSLVAKAAGAHDMARIRFDLRRLAHESLREHGCSMSEAAIDVILGKDFELNAAGLIAWLNREAN